MLPMTPVSDTRAYLEFRAVRTAFSIESQDRIEKAYRTERLALAGGQPRDLVHARAVWNEALKDTDAVSEVAFGRLLAHKD